MIIVHVRLARTEKQLQMVQRTMTQLPAMAQAQAQAQRQHRQFHYCCPMLAFYHQLRSLKDLMVIYRFTCLTKFFTTKILLVFIVSRLPWAPKVRQKDIDQFLYDSRNKFIGYSFVGDHETLAGLPQPIHEGYNVLKKVRYRSQVVNVNHHSLLIRSTCTPV